MSYNGQRLGTWRKLWTCSLHQARGAWRHRTCSHQKEYHRQRVYQLGNINIAFLIRIPPVSQDRNEHKQFLKQALNWLFEGFCSAMECIEAWTGYNCYYRTHPVVPTKGNPASPPMQKARPRSLACATTPYLFWCRNEYDVDHRHNTYGFPTKTFLFLPPIFVFEKAGTSFGPMAEQ